LLQLFFLLQTFSLVWKLQNVHQEGHLNRCCRQRVFPAVFPPEFLLCCYPANFEIREEGVEDLIEEKLPAWAVEMQADLLVDRLWNLPDFGFG
jgi:hypothetical protein